VDSLRQWLLPSFWETEEELHAIHKKLKSGILEWALNMTSFKEWRNSSPGSNENLLWIRGPPRVGKTTAAALIIDGLKQSYGGSLVTYFFCKSGKGRLSNVRDIIRTIAFQCALADKDVRSGLESLKRAMFSITNESDISAAFSKLLHEPLSRTAKDIFIVLDGIDEIANTSERQIIIDSFVELSASRSSTEPAVRILVLSRPHVHNKRLSPRFISAVMDYQDNERDIQTYVSDVIAGPTDLKTRFIKAGIDPLIYFTEKSNGTFIWAARTLEELQKTKSAEEFCSSLKSLAEGSESREALYINLLSGYDGLDRRRINVSLQWVVTAQRPLSVPELKTLVEWSLQDEIYDFTGFLDTECSCLLRCEGGTSSVELIDRKLRPILVNSERWPDYVDLRMSNGKAAIFCLKCLATEDDQSRMFIKYAARFWTDHISQSALSGTVATEVLLNLFNFFSSKNLNRWIKTYLINTHKFFLTERYEFDEPNWSSVLGWLKAMETPPKNEEVVAAIEWRKIVLGKNTFADYLGKAAVSVWLSTELEEFTDVAAAFHLAFQYYREQASKNDPEDPFYDLFTTGFRPMIDWAGVLEYDKRNVGIAYASRRRYHQAIESYKLSNDRNNPLLWEYIGHMYHALGQFQLEIEQYEIARQKNPRRALPLVYLACAYKFAGETSKAQSCCHQAIELDPSVSWLEQYISSRDYSSTIPGLDNENMELRGGSMSLQYFFSFIQKPVNPRVI